MNTFGIYTKGEFLDLNDESTIRLEKINPFFVNELYQGDHSFPYDFPLTEKNKRIFGFANYLDVSERILEYDAWLYLAGSPHSKYKLRITGGSMLRVSGILIGGIKALKSADMKLSEIPLGDDFYLGSSISAIAATASAISKVLDWKIYGFTFVPFYQPDFYDGKNNAFVGVVNQMNSTTGDIIVVNSLVNGNQNAIVPFLFLFHVLNKIFEYEGLAASGSFWTHKEYSRLLLSNNYALDGGQEKYNLKAIKNVFQAMTTNGQRITFDIGPAGSMNNTVGGWDATPGPTGSYYIITIPGKFYVDVVLDCSVNGFYSGPGEQSIVRAKLYYNFVEVASVDFYRPEWSPSTPFNEQKGYITYEINATLADIGKTVLLEFQYTGSIIGSAMQVRKGSYFAVTQDSVVNSLDNSVKFRNHVDEKTVGEFLSEVKKLGVQMDFDFHNSSVKLDTVDTLLNSSEKNKWNEKADPSYELNLEDAGKGVKIFYEFPEEEKVNLTLDPRKFKGEFYPRTFLPVPANIDDWAIINNTNEVLIVGKNAMGVNEWIIIGYNYKPYIIGRGETELTLKLAPMQMATVANAGGTADQNAALMPRVFGKGSSTLFGLGLNIAPMRLVFLRGKNRETSATPQGGNYILANSGNYGINGDINGDITFRLDQQNGMILKTGDKLYKAINDGVVVEKNINLDPLDVFNLKSFCKISVDYNVWLLKSISIAVSKTLIQAKVYILKL